MTILDLLSRAVEHHRADRLSEAQALYRGVLTLDPAHPDALNLLGVAMRGAGRCAEAIGWLVRALQVLPHNAGARHNLDNAIADAVRIGQESYRAGRWDDLAAFAGAVLQHVPDELHMLQFRGLAAHYTGHPDEAVPWFRRALVRKPEWSQSLYLLGLAHKALNQADDAARLLFRSVAVDGGNRQAQYALAEALEATRRFEESECWRRAAVSLTQAHGWYIPGVDANFGNWLGRSPVRFGRRVWDAELIDLCVARCRRRRRVLDVGGHVGSWSWLLAHHFERVEAFEPSDVLRECFHRNVPQGNVTLHPVALGECEGTVQMNFHPLNPGQTHVDPARSGTVPMTTLDHFGFRDVDLIKIDTEGFEYFILAGARATLLANRPLVLVEQAEWNARYGLEPMAAITYLESLGARVVASLPEGNHLLAWDAPGA